MNALPASSSQKKKLHPGLALGLLVAIGLTWWSFSQDDDSGDAGHAAHAAAGHASVRSTMAPRAGNATLAGAANAKSSASAGPLSMSAQELMDQINQMQARADFPAPPTAAQNAWGSILPPPPPPVKAPPPPPPMAPPFPYQYVGRFEGLPEPAEAAAPASGSSTGAAANSAQAVVAGPSTTLVVKAGDVIEGQWRIVSIQGSQMQVLYLPLTQTQTISMKRS